MSRAQDLSAEIRAKLDELDVELAKTPGEPSTTIETAADLTKALTTGGSFRVMPGNYVGNFIARVPVKLFSDGAVLSPSDIYNPALTILAPDSTLQGHTVNLGAPDREALVVGDFDATDAVKQPNNVLIDTCTVKAGDGGGKRGISLHGSNLTVRGCKVQNFWRVGQDAVGIWMHNGPGPYLVENNWVESSGENIMTGGATIKIVGCVPTDVTIRGNTCYKPDSWRPVTGQPQKQVKNCIELKNCRRGLIENNICDGNWKQAQNGNPIVLTVRNQDGDTPWVIVDDIVVRGNITKRCTDGPGLAILGWDPNKGNSQQSQTMLIEHNLFSDSPMGFSIGNGVAKSLIIRYNTIPKSTYNFMTLSDTRSDASKPANWGLAVKNALTFEKNVVMSGQYGCNGTDAAPGTQALNAYCDVKSFNDNVIEKSAARPNIPYPGTNRMIEPGGLAALLDPQTFKMLDGTAGY